MVEPMLRVPEGWALVPVKMTDAMDAAGWPADTAQEGWQRAIAAAPKPDNEGEWNERGNDQQHKSAQDVD